VTVRITPRANTMLSPVHVRAAGYEQVHLTGVTQEASVTVRLLQAGAISVSGETIGGERFAASRSYRACAPPPKRTRRHHEPAPVTGGGEG
jgi:hypothetical protein